MSELDAGDATGVNHAAGPATAIGTGLDGRIVEWVGVEIGGTVIRVERALARREAWLVDVERTDGSVLELFLRLAHAGDPANSTEALAKEARVVQALAGRGIPVPAIHGILDDPHVVLFERVAGRPDLHTMADEQQDAVYRHYLEVLGALHSFDVASLDLGDLHRPVDALDCAMAEVDVLAGSVASADPQPFARFGMAWLRRNAPEHVERIALLHGDTGIANFLFVDDRVTAAIDWEWAHLGDPMEDLGSLCIHASFSPSGDWPALLPHYEKTSGIAVELDKVRYYRVHNLARSVLALAPIRARLNSRDPVALNQCFAIICDRLLCEAIAEAMGVTLSRPAVPEPAAETTLYDIVVENLERDVLDHVVGDFPRDRLQMAALLVRTLARQQALGPWADAAELDELEGVLGSRPSDVASGRAALDALITADDGGRDLEILQTLAAMAYRTEAIAAPVVSLFGNTKLRPVG